ncbi:MAG: SUMF1/EgtB/PvdO family nonheme iron enzyme [Planctomycetes bacterium]|nr:SUMF1/EgtB/PvdO family nonheme iron enzyme [Planctomycetota bacterium]MCB9869870.1 SUMF1/EgtB/PvdO family nonheme iron enzyme [Planctomycetota bacterium]MCB9889100.1 SUMF1/EgtB/PvdO family nonheme iron enzyme [Planctomycetota bacterium]
MMVEPDEDDPLEGFLREYWGARDLAGDAPATTQSPSPETFSDTGNRFGRYQLLEPIGEGGQGVVFLANDTRLRRRVALKLLTGVATTSPNLLGRFRREAELAGKLDHPGICTIHDSGVHEGTPFIAMQYVEGSSLAARIASAKSHADLGRNLVSSGTDVAGDQTASATRGAVMATIQLIEDVARALHVAHEAGIVHRDIKPANIMLPDEGSPTVLDFGIAADLEDDSSGLTHTGDLFGTPAYMSPEQLTLRARELDRRSDVFSLGVTLYECLTLRRPFDAPTREGTYHAIRTLEPIPPRRLNPAVPRDLEVVLAVALEKDRNRRYETAIAFAEELRRVREHEPIRARPAGPALRLVRWAQRRPALASALGSLFVVLTAALAWTGFLLGLARERLALANSRLEKISQLADLTRVRDLAPWSDALFPPAPGIVGGPRGVDAWLARAEALVGRGPEHRVTRDRLRARISAAAPRTPEERVASDLDAVRLQALDELIAEIDALPGKIAKMRGRREFAATMDDRCLERHRLDWRAAATVVAGDPRFRGLHLVPQRGLVPLGPDADSGLVEFAHLQSGSVPHRDPRTKQLQMDGESAIVLVLLPGGAFTMGQSPEPGAVHRVANAEPDAGPEHEVTLDPFFLGKYEVTQGQWLRVMDTEPSDFRPGAEVPGVRETFTLRHPVEQVSYPECQEAMRRLGLVLPTEAQWEYACRAGTHTVYSTGNEPASLRGFANILDAANGRKFGRRLEPDFDDGYRFHAPVGSYRANGFGLHDMHGNVWETCRDWKSADYRTPVRSGDGLRLVPERLRREIVARGGSFEFDSSITSCGQRSSSTPEHHFNTQGLRAARSLQR